MTFSDFLKNLNPFRSQTVSRVSLVTTSGTGILAWNGKLYKSDIIRSCIRPKAKAIGKMTIHHVRDGKNGREIDPDAYMKYLLNEPNPYMTGQQFLERMITTLELNGNAFALITRDANGVPTELYPLSATSAEAIVDKRTGVLSIRFSYRNGQTGTFPYDDIIHLRHDYGENDFFGSSPVEALRSCMEVLNATDQGVVTAVKNGSVIRWIMKFNQVVRPEQQKQYAKEFADSFLDSNTNDTTVAVTDSKADLQRVEPKDFVPNAMLISHAEERVYSYFNTNKNIIEAKYSENEWLAYYETAIEPDLVQISMELSRKLFTRRERALGNRIVCEAASLAFASLQTKLSLINLVDRGIMTPNEMRETLSMTPIEGGDKPIRRLDTAVVETTEEGGNE